MSQTDHVLVFLNFWGLTFKQPFVSAMFHSPLNPSIAESMSKELEKTCSQYNLRSQKTEDYPGSITNIVSGGLLSWTEFGKFFRQSIFDNLSLTQTKFNILTKNINYGESHGALDVTNSSEEQINQLLHSNEPRILPPSTIPLH